jgi:hypothetical protein
MEPARDYFAKHNDKYSNFEEFVSASFSQETMSKILGAELKGKIVYIGRLGSENNEIESFFCTDSFIIDTEKLYIDATDDAW